MQTVTNVYEILHASPCDCFQFRNRLRLRVASSAGISPDESGGGKKFGEMPAINRHKNLHCAYRLAHANFDKRKLRGSRKGLQQGVEKFLFSTRWL